MEAISSFLQLASQGSQGGRNAYKTQVINNWADFIDKAWEVQEAILHRTKYPSKINCGGSGSLSLGAGCAAGDACKAQPEANLANSPHCCRGCGLKIHLELLCGMRLNEFITKYPHLVGL
jgi:hypothetical protein